MSSYTIVIEDLEVEMFLGLHEFEKRTMQRVLISLKIGVSNVDYDAGKFFDYDDVVNFVRGFKSKHIETQEELTKTIYEFVMDLGCDSALVHSRKPDVYPDCKSVGLVFQGD